MPPLPQLLLLLLTVVFAAKAVGALTAPVGALTARSRRPAVFGEILIGLLAGPPGI